MDCIGGDIHLGAIPSANGYRLPTELEWQNACWRGLRNVITVSDRMLLFSANTLYTEAGLPTEYRVADRLSNFWGLFDMHGGVAEWCHDNTRITRGGSRGDSAAVCTSSFRDDRQPVL